MKSYEQFEEAIQDLANRQAGWVTRRDGAVALGDALQTILDALRSHLEDPDQDVRLAVERALQGTTPTGAPPRAAAAPREAYSLEKLAAACEKPGRRSVRQEGEGFLVEVQLREGRRQNVHLDTLTRLDGKELLRIYTFCGEADQKVRDWVLRSNARLAQCAFALLPYGNEDRAALVSNFYREQATPEAVVGAVKEAAFYGDWLEKKISGADEF